jgi:hypothetical protein
VTRYTSDAQQGGEAILFDKALSDYQRLPFGEVTQFAWTIGKWLAYTQPVHKVESFCTNPFLGEVWLANMETLEVHHLVTDAVYIYQPVWRP